MSLFSLALASALAVTFHAVTLTPKLVLLAVAVSLALLVGTILAHPKLYPTMSSRFLCFLSSVLSGWLTANAADVYAQVGFIDVESLFIAPRGLFTNTQEASEEAIVVQWTTPRFKGLIALVWLMTLFGTAIQLYLYRKYGEDPDLVWNGYLPQAIGDMERHDVSLNGRLGVFQPHQAFLKRIIGRISGGRSPARRTPWLTPDSYKEIDPFDLDAPDSKEEKASIPPSRYDPEDFTYSYETTLTQAHPPPSALSTEPKAAGQGETGLERFPSKASISSELSGSTLVNASPTSMAPGAGHKLLASPSSSDLHRIHVFQRSEDSVVSARWSKSDLPQAGTVKSAIRSLFRHQRTSTAAAKYFYDTANLTESDGPSSLTRLPSGPATGRRNTLPDWSDTQGFQQAPAPKTDSLENDSRQHRTTAQTNAPQSVQGPPQRNARPSADDVHGDRMTMEATPSLIHAIHRVSQAQTEAKLWREQQAQPKHRQQQPNAHGTRVHSVREASIEEADLGEAQGTVRSEPQFSQPEESRRLATEEEARAAWWSKVEQKASE